MKLVRRNLVPIYYCLYKKKEPILDEYGNETSEYKVVYHKPVKLMVNVSPAMGYAQVEQFGNLETYDKIIITDDVNCPIDENTVLFVDKRPKFVDDIPPEYDYIVKRAAKSLNSISYAISKVKVQ